MSAGARIAAFAGVLALVFSGAMLAGAALEPDPPAKAVDDHAAPHSDGSDPAARHHAAAPATGERPMRLEVSKTRLRARERVRLDFRVIVGRAETVRDFEIEHERRMHVIVVRRDLSGFRHVHPVMRRDGTWTMPLRLAEAGTYRLFADFRSGGVSRTIGQDLQVSGRYEPRDLPHPAGRVMTRGGYSVTIAEDHGRVRFGVRAAGRPVRDLERYLGARGHLVALRQGDLEFLHVHPEPDAGMRDGIGFRIEYPTPGRYRLFLQFKHAGRVHRAEFTREVGVAHGH